MPKQQEINKDYVILGQYNSRHVFKYVTLYSFYSLVNLRESV